jgi:hypothetical protein
MRNSLADLNNHLSREKAEDWIYKNAVQWLRYIFLHQHTVVAQTAATEREVV